MNNKSKTKNILYISSRGDISGGGEHYLLRLFRNIDRQRFQPIVILPNDGSLRKPLEELKIEVIVIEANHGWLKPDQAWYNLIEGLQSRVKAIVDIIIDRQISIVHTNSNHRFEGALAARLTGIPHLYLAHIEYQPDMPIFQRLPFSQASFSQLMSELSDQIVTVSNSVAKTLATQVDKKKLKVIHNGLDISLFNEALEKRSDWLKQELMIPLESQLITAVGRITPDKGFDFFLEIAWHVLQIKKNGIHFIIVGNDENIEFSNHLKQQVLTYGISDNFHFLGFRYDIADILAASDIFILSSRREGHPYVMLEAMAAECAVIAFNCAGVEETIENGISGFIIPNGDVNAMADRLITLVDSPELRASLAKSAKQRITDFFTADKTAMKLMTTYESLLQNPKNSAGSFTIELFLQNCTEIGHLGKINFQMNERLKHIEHLVDYLENNIFAKVFRFFRMYLKKLI